MKLSIQQCNSVRRAAVLAGTVTLGMLVGCSNSSDSTSQLDPEGAPSVVTTQPSFAVLDIEDVSSAQLAVVDTASIESSGLSSVFFNTELGCDEGWQVTAFDFDRDSSTVNATLCDSTAFSANYEIVDSAIKFSNVSLDGATVETDTYEYWGLLPVEGNPDQWRACYFTYDDDVSDLDGTDLNATTSVNFLPPQELVNFDCSEEAYIFLDADLANQFLAEVAEV